MVSFYRINDSDSDSDSDSMSSLVIQYAAPLSITYIFKAFDAKVSFSTCPISYFNS